MHNKLADTLLYRSVQCHSQVALSGEHRARETWLASPLVEGWPFSFAHAELIPSTGLEPVTRRLEICCSIQLSYEGVRHQFYDGVRNRRRWCRMGVNGVVNCCFPVIIVVVPRIRNPYPGVVTFHFHCIFGVKMDELSNDGNHDGKRASKCYFCTGTNSGPRR